MKNLPSTVVNRRSHQLALFLRQKPRSMSEMVKFDAVFRMQSRDLVMLTRYEIIQPPICEPRSLRPRANAVRLKRVIQGGPFTAGRPASKTISNCWTCPSQLGRAMSPALHTSRLGQGGVVCVRGYPVLGTPICFVQTQETVRGN